MQNLDVVKAATKKLQYFNYKHLPKQLQEHSKPFHDLAHKILSTPTHDVGEAIISLNKLLEAKDAFVRSQLDGD